MADINLSVNVSGLKRATEDTKQLATTITQTQAASGALSNSLSKVGAVASSAGKAAGKGIEAISNASSKALDGVKELANGFPIIENSLGTLSGVGSAIGEIGSAAKGASGGVSGLGKAIGVAFAASGVGLVLAIVNALLQFKEVSNAVNKVLAGLSGALNVVFNSFDKVRQIASDVGSLFGNVLTGNFSAASKSISNISKGFKELGQAAVEGFTKTSEAFDKLAVNEKARKAFEQTRELVEGQIQLNEALAENETLTEAQRNRIAEKNLANRRAIVAQELALAKERLTILTGLGKAASAEQRDEIIELQKQVAQGQKELQIIATQGANQRVSAALRASERIIAQQRAETELRIDEIERQVAKEKELANISAEQQIDALVQLQNTRLRLVDDEAKALRDRAKKAGRQLTEDELDRVNELERQRIKIVRDNEDELDDLRKKLIDNAANAQRSLIEQEQVLLNLKEAQLKAEETGAEVRSVIEGLEIQRAEERVAKEKSIEAIKDLQAAKQNQINNATLEAVRKAEKERDIATEQLTIQQKRLEVDIDRIEALKALGEAGAADLQQLELLKTQLDATKAQIDTITKTTEDKIKVIQTNAVAQSEALGVETGKAFVANFQKELQAVGSLVGSSLQVVGQAFDTALELQAAQIEAAAKAVDQAIKEANDRIKRLEESAKESASRVTELETKIAQSTGAARDALLTQLDTEIAKRAKLEKDKEAELQAQKKREEERANLDKQKLEQERAAARIRNIITIAQAYAQLALAIASAAAASGPLAPVTIATVAAAGAAAIGSTIAAIPSFKKGGILVGASHEQGGILAVKNGRPIAEVEGGEIILTKAVAQNPVLRQQASQINAKAGGARFEQGGVLPDDTANTVRELKRIIQTLPPPVVSVVDIAEAQRRVKTIDSRA